MLPGGTDLLYRQALASGFEPYSRLEIWRQSVQIEQNLTFFTASVQATLTSRVARTLDVEVHEDMYPFEPDDLLAPSGNEIRAFAGIKFAEGSQYVWPVFRGRIANATLTEGNLCLVTASDRAADINSASFEVPENSQVGNTIDEEFVRLVSDALVDATFGSSDTFFETVPIETWEHSRSSALDEMATSVGAYWYPLADGRFVIRRYPWTVPGDPVIILSDGDNGSIFSSSATRSRSSVFNSVTVTGERTDGTGPVFHTARDEVPTSPTYVNGPFGLRNRQRQLQTPQTQQGAKAAAEDSLRQTIALTESWNFTCSPDASLELGDVLALDVRGRTGIVQVVSSFILPLDGSGSMSVQARSQVIGSLEATG